MIRPLACRGLWLLRDLPSGIYFSLGRYGDLVPSAKARLLAASETVLGYLIMESPGGLAPAVV
jgi:hypothetical protein